jgi:hypothetical protein
MITVIRSNASRQPRPPAEKIFPRMHCLETFSARRLVHVILLPAARLFSGSFLPKTPVHRALAWELSAGIQLQAERVELPYPSV